MVTGKKFVMILGFTMTGLLMAALFVRAEAGDKPMSTAEQTLKGQTEDELGLSPEQRDKMQALREEFSLAQKNLSEEVKTKRDALRVALEGDKPDRKKVESLVTEVSDIQKKLMLNRADNIFKVRDLLTPEQYKKLQELHMKSKEKMGEKAKKGTKGKAVTKSKKNKK